MVHVQVSLGGLLLCLQFCHCTIIVAEGSAVLGWLFQYECSRENPKNQTTSLHTASKVQHLGKCSSCQEIDEKIYITHIQHVSNKCYSQQLVSCSSYLDSVQR